MDTFGQVLSGLRSYPCRCGSKAQALVVVCDVMLVVGTSGVVQPAAGLPAAAFQAGKWVVINPVPLRS